MAEFSHVTENVDQAIQRDDQQLLIESIRHNHQLLVKIGVVPEKVQKFIAEVEKSGGAAKICGAGSIRGDAAGAVLVTPNQDLTDLIQNYRYDAMTIQGELQGARVI